MILPSWCLSAFCRWLGSLSLCCCFLFFACLFRIFASFDVLSILYRVHICCFFGSRFARVYLMGVWWTDFRLAPIALLSMYMNRILLVPLKTLSKVQCWTVIYVMACIQMQMKVKQCKSLTSSGSNGRSQEIIWWRSVLRNHAPCIQLQYVSMSITLKSTKSPCWYGTLRDKQNAMMLNQWIRKILIWRGTVLPYSVVDPRTLESLPNVEM